MATKTQMGKKPTMTKVDASKVLGNTPYMKGFHFYAALGNYTEETVTSISEFVGVLRTIDEGSIGFHFPRGDFQKWIRETIGDTELAERIDSIKSITTIGNLRNQLVETVQIRITELERISGK